MKRRKNMRRTSRRSRPVFGLFLMMCLAVGSGYLGVKYIVSPWMDQKSASAVSGDTVTAAETETTIREDKIETVTTTAYAVQLGSFSTEEAAKDRVAELKDQGITATVQLRDNAWKVVSEGFSTRDEAKAAAIQWRDVIGDAFVVAI